MEIEKLFTRYKIYVDRSSIYGKDTSQYLTLTTDLYSKGISINRYYDLDNGLYWLEFDIDSDSPELYKTAIGRIEDLINNTILDDGNG